MAPRNEEQNQKIKDERHQQIIKAASRVFARRGLAATKIADIAAAAGMSHGLVYHYFPSKEAVYAAIVAEAMEGATLVTAGALQQPGTPWERLHWMTTLMLQGVREQPDYFLIVVQTFAGESMPEEVNSLVRDQGMQPFMYMVQLIQEAQAAGQVVAGNPGTLAVSLYALIQGLATYSLSPVDMTPYFPDADTVLRLMKK